MIYLFLVCILDAVFNYSKNDFYICYLVFYETCHVV